VSSVNSATPSPSSVLAFLPKGRPGQQYERRSPLGFRVHALSRHMVLMHDSNGSRCG
jgi:hypothetical protein